MTGIVYVEYKIEAKYCENSGAPSLVPQVRCVLYVQNFRAARPPTQCTVVHWLGDSMRVTL